jgi:hypothetical protein
MPKPNNGGAAARNGRQPDTHALPSNVVRPVAGVKSVAPADPLTLAIEAAVTRALESFLEQIEELVGGQRASGVVDSQGFCQHFGVSSPTLRKLIEQGLPHFKLGELKRFSISACEKWLAYRGQS